MSASATDVIGAAIAVGILVLGLAGCDTDRPGRFATLTSPSAPPPAPPAPAPSPLPNPAPPLPTRFGPLEYTPIEIGAVVRGPLVMPPECYDFGGWPCRYFELTPPASGRLRVVLTYSSASQGGQGVDLSMSPVDGIGWEYWAQFGSATETRLEAPVIAGRAYRIAMWYAFEGLEFELTTSLQ